MEINSSIFSSVSLDTGLVDAMGRTIGQYQTADPKKGRQPLISETGDAEFRIAVAINHTVSEANCNDATRHLIKVVPGNCI